MMFRSTYSILDIFCNASKIYGRKKVQKMVHLLEAQGAELPFKYEYHHYGPYSAELQEELNYLVRQGLLAESRADEAYVYEITPKGKEFKEKLEREEGYTTHLDYNLLHDLTKQNSQFLEMVSTYAYLLETGHDREYARKKALELKSHLSGYMDEAIQYYETKIKKH